MKIIIIGIPDKDIGLSLEQISQIENARYFAGGNRHYELVKKYLPKNSEWTSITSPLSKVYTAISECPEPYIVFASGDPLFFGIGVSLRKKFPKAEILIYPYFNSLQTLAHKIGLSYGEYLTISLTGRPWCKFDKALILGEKYIGILTDRKNTPSSIAKRMLLYNYDNYIMHYGEHIGGKEEKIMELTLEQALTLDFKHPNCFFLEKTDNKIPQKGISELDFKPLLGRPKMITKLPIRLTTIALMYLNNYSTFWDIGSCTGSMAIDTKLHYPDLNITAFEKREESDAIINYNCQKFQTPGIKILIGDYMQIDKTKFNKPDAVFMGGYNGEMENMLLDINKYLQKDGILAFNSVSERSKIRFINWCKENNYKLLHKQLIVIDTHNPITILIAKK